MRLIDADKLKETLKNSGAHHSIRPYIDSQPTVDAKPVVRCKDCKYFTNNIADENLRKNFCDRIQVNCFHPVKENDFCSYGARKDEEAEQE